MAITVTALHTTPIKALRIRAVDSIELGPTGALGDRAFYLVDEDGAMVNGCYVTHYPSASYLVRKNPG